MSEQVTNQPAAETPNAGDTTQKDADNSTVLGDTPATETPAKEPAPDAPASEPTKEPAKEPEKAKPVAPEKYDLKLPSGSLLEKSAVERIASYAKERGLSQEDAQSLLERESQAVSGFAEAQRAELEGKVESWKQEVEDDKEIGGAAFKQNVELAHRVLARYGSPSLRQALNETGLGNHPELVRVFVRIGKAMADDQLVMPGTQSAGKRPIEEVFYGNPNN